MKDPSVSSIIRLKDPRWRIRQYPVLPDLRIQDEGSVSIQYYQTWGSKMKDPSVSSFIRLKDLRWRIRQYPVLSDLRIWDEGSIRLPLPLDIDFLFSGSTDEVGMKSNSLQHWLKQHKSKGNQSTVSTEEQLASSKALAKTTQIKRKTMQRL